MGVAGAEARHAAALATILGLPAVRTRSSRRTTRSRSAPGSKTVSEVPADKRGDVDPSLEVVVLPSWRELRRRLPRLFARHPAARHRHRDDARGAALGVSPYDVLHQGLSERTGLSFGTVVVLLGLLILLAWIPLRQRPGIGTVINTLTVGFIVDLVLIVMPEPEPIAWRALLLVGGIVVTAIGMGLYIGSGLGPGPRDGLMTGIAAKGPPIWIGRTGLELIALAIGWALGGDVGVGTVLFALSIGPLGHFFLGSPAPRRRARIRCRTSGPAPRLIEGDVRRAGRGEPVARSPSPMPRSRGRRGATGLGPCRGGIPSAERLEHVRPGRRAIA